MDWHAFLFDPAAPWLKRLEAVARRRFQDDNLGDQAFEEALGKLAENEWARLGQFQGRSSPGTFLLCVFRNLIEDAAVARFGRCRAPVWVQRLGSLWELIHKRLCCERQEPESLARRLATADFDGEAIRAACRTLKARIPGCGERIRFQTLDTDAGDEDAPALDPPGAPGEDPARRLDTEECGHVLASLAALLADTPDPGRLTENGARLAELQAGLIEAMPAEPELRLVLRLVFQDGISLAQAATAAGLAEHTARRQLKRVLETWAAQLRRAGFEAGDFVDDD